MSVTIASLQVNRAGLVAAFSTLRKMKKPRNPGDALVTFEGENITFAVLGLTLRAKAEGSWVGQARITSAFLIRLTMLPPLNDPVPVRVADGHFYIENAYTECIWEPVEENRIELPINVTFLRLLALGFYHSRDEIARSGLLKEYEDAVKQREALITRATNVLVPLGITREEVARLVEESLRGFDFES